MASCFKKRPRPTSRTNVHFPLLQNNMKCGFRDVCEPVGEQKTIKVADFLKEFRFDCQSAGRLYRRCRQESTELRQHSPALRRSPSERTGPETLGPARTTTIKSQPNTYQYTYYRSTAQAHTQRLLAAHWLPPLLRVWSLN